jgi:peptidyl-prolyl cis-trans isomerase B (cyclophilin B)
MAHAGKNTGGSQFFLVRAPQPHLDGKHTLFGQVISGVEIIDRLQNGDIMEKVTILNKSSTIENHNLVKM